MSTSRNRTKEESDRTTSGGSRKSAKSIGPGPRDSFTPQDSPVHASPASYLYQCPKCNFILANSNSLLRNLTQYMDLLFFPADSENFMISAKEVELTSEPGFDQFCAYNPVRCSSCKHALGKYYLSVTEKMAAAKSVLVIHEDNVLFYNVGIARVTSPSGKKAKGEQTTAKKVVNTSVVKKGKENKTPGPVQEGDRMDFSKSAKTKERAFSPEVGNMEEKKINEEKKITYEKKPSGKEEQQMKEVESCFAEMKGILSNFAALLEQFDARITSSERTIELVNSTMTKIMSNMNTAECIDLSD